MPAEPQNPAQLDCRTPAGRVIAKLDRWPARHSASFKGEDHPLIRWSDLEAQSRGEEPVQLRERGRYVYRLEPVEILGSNLVLAEERGITRSPAAVDGRDEGFIEP